jgi:hypothetical protein
MRGAYNAFVGSRLDCCAAAWSPFLSDTRQNELKIIQNQAAHIITECVSSAPIDSFLLEAELMPLSVRQDAQLAIVAEKLRRLPDSDPLYRSTTFCSY